MGRPPKDPGGPATETLSLRLTAEDRALLDRLVRARAEELVDEAVEVSVGSYMRALIRREARAKGFLEDPASAVAEVRKVPTTDDVRAMLVKAIEAGALQTEIAGRASIPEAKLSKFKNGKHVLSPDSLKKLAAVLARHLR